MNSDTDYVTGDAEEEKDSYEYDVLPWVGSEIIRGIHLNTVAKRTDTLGVNITPFIRVQDTDYSQTEKTLTDTYVIYRNIIENNPYDSQTWEYLDLSQNFEGGVEVSYIESTAYARITQQVIEILRTVNPFKLFNVMIIT